MAVQGLPSPQASRRKFLSMAAASAAFVAARLPARAQGKPLAFEVFSIRSSDPDAKTDGWRLTPDGFTMKACLMWDMVMVAYFPLSQFGFQTLKGAPDWMNKERFDVTAKVAAEDLVAWQAHTQDPNTKPLAEAMLQTALADRCKLVVRRVPKDAPAFTLEQGKHGTKLMPTPAGAKPPADSYPFIGGATVTRSTVDERNTVKFYGATLAQLISFLTLSAHSTIKDNTGLPGKYDFTLVHQEQTVDNGQPTDPNTFWNIEALGLHVVTSKTTVDSITIEHIERPSPN